VAGGQGKIICGGDSKMARVLDQNKFFGFYA